MPPDAGLRCLPAWLKASAAVDLAQVLFSIRPALRTELRGPVDGAAIRRWAWNLRCSAARDSDGFLVLSKSAAISRRVLEADRRRGDHTYPLGLLLGYPRCCCRAAAGVGDEGLDAWCGRFSGSDFQGAFKAIDPRGYVEGRALISHVPCSPRCLPSLRMAEALMRILGPARVKTYFDTERFPVVSARQRGKSSGKPRDLLSR
jgi:hypothetical protein